MAEDIKFEFEFSLKNIREHREEQGISQLKLSQMTHLSVPQGVISDLESGFRKLTSYTALPLANALKTNIFGLFLAQEMSNKGIVSLKDREKLVEDIAKGNTDLLKAYKSAGRVVKTLDFGDRDSFGRKLDKEQIASRKDKDSDLITRDSFGRKRTEKEIKERRREVKKRKEAKKRREDFDLYKSLGRDSFGRKIIAKKMVGDFDDLDLEGLDEDDKFLAMLKQLIKKGKERQKMK